MGILNLYFTYNYNFLGRMHGTLAKAGKVQHFIFYLDKINLIIIII